MATPDQIAFAMQQRIDNERSQRQTRILGIAAVLLTAAAAFWYFGIYKKKKKDEPTPTPTPIPTVTPTPTPTPTPVVDPIQPFSGREGEIVKLVCDSNKQIIINSAIFAPEDIAAIGPNCLSRDITQDLKDWLAKTPGVSEFGINLTDAQLNTKLKDGDPCVGRVKRLTGTFSCALK